MDPINITVHSAPASDFSVWTLVPIIISVAALIVAIFTFSQQRKSDQFKTALEMSYNILDLRRRFIKIQDSKEGEQKDKGEREVIEEILVTCDLVAWLVNEKEISNPAVRRYFINVCLNYGKFYKDIIKNNPLYPALEKLLLQNGIKL